MLFRCRRRKFLNSLVGAWLGLRQVVCERLRPWHSTASGAWRRACADTFLGGRREGTRLRTEQHGEYCQKENGVLESRRTADERNFNRLEDSFPEVIDEFHLTEGSSMGVVVRCIVIRVALGTILV